MLMDCCNLHFLCSLSSQLLDSQKIFQIINCQSSCIFFHYSCVYQTIQTGTYSIIDLFMSCCYVDALLLFMVTPIIEIREFVMYAVTRHSINYY